MERKLRRWLRENDFDNWTNHTEVLDMLHKYGKEMALEAWYEGIAEMDARKKMPKEPFLEFDEWWYQVTN
jgi:hypothetical protein